MQEGGKTKVDLRHDNLRRTVRVSEEREKLIFLGYVHRNSEQEVQGGLSHSAKLLKTF